MTVHAVGYDESRKISYATNGNKGECTGEVGNCGCIHAEINLLELLPNPVKVYVSHSPCLNCAIALVGSGVEEVRYQVPYRITDGIDYLEEHGVKVARIT